MLDPRISSLASFRACSVKWVYNFSLDRRCHISPALSYIYFTFSCYSESEFIKQILKFHQFYGYLSLYCV